ncbi:MAG: proton-conducting membrane transporter [Planctomycetota bacterium]|nr:MAG: proton-conducting membrane transporter [Planctomycetota bacterium]
MGEMITINVDGVDREVDKDQPLIEALGQAGAPTPNFCYHPDLKVAGNCRICLVEVEGPRGPALMISCHLRPAPGMKVRTEASSEKVVKARKGVMEFLLVNHPLDCPICDKAGECTLQEHYMTSGRHESRLPEEVEKAYKGGADHRFTDTKGVSRGGKHIDLGPTIILDQERCILCDRCTRFMRDVAGDEQLYIAGRGDHAYITTFPGEPLDHAYDLNTTDICPVGALTGKDFRFQQRVWFLKKTNSIAPDDSLGANLTIEHHRGKVWRLMPRRNPEVNKSWIHNETRLLYQELDRNRLTAGAINGAPATLGESMMAAGKALAKAGRVALVASGHLTCEDNAALLALAARLGEKAEVFAGSWLPIGEADGIARSGDPVANRRALQLMGLPDNLDALVERAAEFDTLLVIGHDLWQAAPEKAQALEVIQERVVLDSWNNPSAKAATIVVPVRCWAEIRGTMINCQDRIQMLNACPVCINDELEAVWQVLDRISGHACDAPLALASQTSVWAQVQSRIAALADVQYRHIGPLGLPLTVNAPSLVGAEA